ncbi:hypothetical protein TIFTF001_014234 [Ficus carica]|uniref:Uncharacterized protein n=1 Tax=Ficus carica TaxID=3494 RepID=A0AA88D3U2_FICCA|nr:hypothetical protein TIFTF001_014234 [Ficus carica]
MTEDDKSSPDCRRPPEAYRQRLPHRLHVPDRPPPLRWCHRPRPLARLPPSQTTVAMYGFNVSPSLPPFVSATV